ncbi:MAG: 50S ribosomal protein L10 [Holosporaceae bacterium]|nr:50S ribosomal protein L10 [Holosporaceae bacterium]
MAEVISAIFWFSAFFEMVVEGMVRRDEKINVIANIRKNFQESKAVFVINQNKMTVANTEDLRKQLRSAESTYLVAKNTLTRLAIKDTGFECIQPHLSGQMALVFSKNVTETAKIISEYASKSDEKITVVCGGFDERLLSTSDIKLLAQLPSLDELRGKIIAIIQTPAQRLTMLTRAPAGQIARVLRGYSEK